MATFLVDRVQETTAVTGTGSATLLGATTGYVSFASVGNNNSTYYCIAGQTGSEWEIGLGTYSTTGPTLSRDTVYSNYLGTTAKINFSAGTKNIFVTSPTALLSKLLVPQALTISNGTGIVVKQNNLNGTLGVLNSGGWFFPQAITITQFVARVGISPKGSGSGITIPVKYGTTYLGSTLLRTLVILANQTSTTVNVSNSIPANSYIYLDITNVGTTYPGSGLSIQISYTYTPI
jgi:hypothetical protein